MRRSAALAVERRVRVQHASLQRTFASPLRTPYASISAVPSTMLQTSSSSAASAPGGGAAPDGGGGVAHGSERAAASNAASAPARQCASTVGLHSVASAANARLAPPADTMSRSAARAVLKSGGTTSLTSGRSSADRAIQPENLRASVHAVNCSCGSEGQRGMLCSTCARCSRRVDRLAGKKCGKQERAGLAGGRNAQNGNGDQR